MKLWTWDTMLAEGVESHPEELDAFNSLSRIAYASFEEWLGLDMLKCDLATVIVGCRCPDSLKEQQKEAMTWRRRITGSDDPMQWILRHSRNPRNVGFINALTRRYQRKKLCHRNWNGPRAGIRCYCDEHNHEPQPGA